MPREEMRAILTLNDVRAVIAEEFLKLRKSLEDIRGSNFACQSCHQDDGCCADKGCCTDKGCCQDGKNLPFTDLIAKIAEIDPTILTRLGKFGQAPK